MMNSESSDGNSQSSGSHSNQPIGKIEPNREASLSRVDELEASGDFDEAVNLLRQQLLINPNDTEVIFRIANLTAMLGDLQSAITFLDSISPDDLEAGLPALGQAADWCIDLKRYRDAESRYRKILKIAPNATIAHRRLARLLNRQGRRHEAADHLRELCRLGDVRQDELHALIVLSDAMSIDDSTDSQTDDIGGGLETSQINSSIRPKANSEDTDYSPINQWGVARVLFTQRKYAEAAKALRTSDDFSRVSSDSADNDSLNPPASVFAFYGRVLAEAQEDDEFLKWLSHVEDVASIRDYSEYWSAIGTYLASQQEAESASRAFLEALARDPTDFRSINRLHQMLELLGEKEQAEKWENRWKSYREVLLANNAISTSEQPNVEAMDEIASQLSGIGRNLEAVLWKLLESYHRGLPAEVLNGWNQQREELVSKQECFPSLETRLCGMKREQYSLLAISKIQQQNSNKPTQLDSTLLVSDAPPMFTNVADQLGINHRYQLASSPLDSGFAMYHQAGGGVAVLDYDLDGTQDLYFAQGAADAPSFLSQLPNELYRNEETTFVEVSNLAVATQHSYTIGCTAGDWNQDGFPDLITANIGTNFLWINNGDGTFDPLPIPGTQSKQKMPASLAIADLNGDALPDLFEVNYIEDEDIDMRPDRDEMGRVIEAVGPADFKPAVDRVGFNDGSGNLQFQPLHQNPEATFRGLGVVVADFDEDGINEIFVGNDKSPNQLWTLNTQSQDWLDTAMPRGAAFSFDGGGTASMGIAAGDFDLSGSLDLHVTNFQNENACLYLSKKSLFQDRAAQFRLGVPSYEVLGFGSQTLDFNHDGLMDLAVTNGHIDQYVKMSGPFLQRFQLFKNQSKQFKEIVFDDSSPYALTNHAGRAMAKLDFDNDGREDLIITHINEASALLRNETVSNNHWLQVELVGVHSERDATGAKVTVRVAGQQITQWAISGDGYLCRNHQRLCFGLGGNKKIESLSVDWPSGIQQEVPISAVDQRILVVENIESAHLFIQ